LLREDQANSEEFRMEEDLRPYVSKLSGDPKVDYDALLREIGDAKVVMFGGSTHGTHEFCEERDRITKRLIEEKVRRICHQRKMRKAAAHCIDM
jgi:erythromycin esterase-like protein